MMYDCMLDTVTAEHSYSKSPTHQSPDTRQTDTLVIQGIYCTSARRRETTDQTGPCLQLLYNQQCGPEITWAQSDRTTVN